MAAWLRRHGAQTVRWPAWAGFLYGRPLLAALGRAVVIAEELRECGYPRCVADVVAAQLARPQDRHGIIGRFAVGLLAGAGRRP